LSSRFPTCYITGLRELRRISLPHTWVNKGERRGRSTNADLVLHNFNELPRPIIIVTPRPV
jgi:hypothetical protein